MTKKCQNVFAQLHEFLTVNVQKINILYISINNHKVLTTGIMIPSGTKREPVLERNNGCENSLKITGL